MEWSTLMLAARLYAEHESYDRIYREYLADEHGPSFWGTGAPTIGQANRVLLFVNQWRSRVRRSEDDVRRLQKALHVAKGALSGLRDARLEAIDLTFAERSAIQQGFDLILESLAVKNATAAAKILHMFNRSLFVMWDRSIRVAYGVEGTGSDYADRFLPRAQREVLEAVGTSNGEKPPKPLAKLVDEFNYCKFVARMDPVWDAR